MRLTPGLPYPIALHIIRDTVRGHALVINLLEKITSLILVHESRPKLSNVRFKLFRLEDLMRKGGEGQVEEIRQLTVLEFRRFIQTFPYPLKICRESGLQVCQGCRTNVIANDEEKECTTVCTRTTIRSMPA